MAQDQTKDGGDTMRSTAFFDKSNTRGKQEKKTCSVHLLGFWGQDQWGNWYSRCAVGNRLNEDCKELIEEVENE